MLEKNLWGKKMILWLSLEPDSLLDKMTYSTNAAIDSKSSDSVEYKDNYIITRVIYFVLSGSHPQTHLSLPQLCETLLLFIQMRKVRL